MPRIAAILQNLTATKILIDLGCDHGYLGIASLKQRLVDNVWNVDVNQAPLAVAKNNYTQAQLSAKTTFFLSNGFEKLPKKWEHNQVTAVFAGMGSKLILSLLKDLPPYVQTIIFLPHTMGEKLRYWTTKNNFFVLNEQYVRDKNKVYELIVIHRYFTTNAFCYQTPTDYLMGLSQFWSGCWQQLQDYWTIQLNRWKKIPPKKLSTNQIYQINLVRQALYGKPTT